MTAQVAPPVQRLIVNDFSIQVATVNGSGSQSSNNILMRSIFRMGVPVSGKNMFPSNIAGLPTWFTIRASKHGYIARRRDSEIYVGMNGTTIADDVQKLPRGAVCIYNDEVAKLVPQRDDVIYYPVPFGKIVAQCCPDAKLRKLVVNMIYDGIVAKLLDIELAIVKKETEKQFGKKPKALKLNLDAVQAGWDYATQHIAKRDPYKVERMNATDGKIIIEGNAATALGLMFGGCTVCAWYPITPSSSLAEAFIDYAKKYRHTPEGRATYAVVQAEDELAAIGMTIGAGWAGARAMTSTAGPGISLMAEFVGLAYFAEIPAVIVDVQRGGPSTGLPTRTQQCDILKAATLSHGDTRHVLLIPGSVAECFEFGQISLDLAERLQAIVFVMTDLDLGMNNWMSEPFVYSDKPYDRGKVLSAADLDRLKGEWSRYKDVDGDAIPYRTLPGTKHPSAGYFTRGTGHNEKGQYSERPDDYKRLLDRLKRKMETAKALVPKPVIDWNPRARVGLVAYGSSDPAIPEARQQLLLEHGIETSYCRLRAYPFTQEFWDFAAKHDRIYIIEQNRDAQMRALAVMDRDPRKPIDIRSALSYDGLPIAPRNVSDQIFEQERA
jgi:2-oxoglutarate ferredoxin oxidoreductase subunit alpha